VRPIIRVDIKIPIEVFPEGDMFISYAPTFDVSSQGESVNEAREHLIDALTGFILTCHEMGTLSQVMKAILMWNLSTSLSLSCWRTRKVQHAAYKSDTMEKIGVRFIARRV